MPRHATTRRTVRDRESEGGPWCRACQRWTEVDGDAIAGNTCARCHQPAVVMKGPVWATRVRVSLGGRTLSALEVAERFAEMKAAVEQTTTTTVTTITTNGNGRRK